MKAKTTTGHTGGHQPISGSESRSPPFLSTTITTELQRSSDVILMFICFRDFHQPPHVPFKSPLKNSPAEVIDNI